MILFAGATFAAPYDFNTIDKIEVNGTYEKR